MSEALPIAWAVWENFAIEGDVPRSTEFLSVTQFICEGMRVKTGFGCFDLAAEDGEGTCTINLCRECHDQR